MRILIVFASLSMAFFLGCGNSNQTTSSSSELNGEVVSGKDRGTCARFYEKENYKGIHWIRCTKNDFRILRGSNNKISSFKIPDGYEVKLCTGAKATGSCTHAVGNAKKMGRFNNKISWLSRIGKLGSID